MKIVVDETDLKARKKASLEAFQRARAEQLRALKMSSSSPALKEWPLCEPFIPARMNDFLHVYEQAYRNGMPSHFLGTGPTADQRVNLLLEEVRSAIGGDPYWWEVYFTKLRLRCLLSTCKTLYLDHKDLPWWLRGLQPGVEQKNRFHIIFESL